MRAESRGRMEMALRGFGLNDLLELRLIEVDGHRVVPDAFVHNAS